MNTAYSFWDSFELDNGKKLSVTSFADKNMELSIGYLRDSIYQIYPMTYCIGRSSLMYPYGTESLDKEFYLRNKAVLDQERGAGYWLWKPLIIKKRLDLMAEGDYLLYCDAGVSLLRDIQPMIDMLDKDLFLFNNEWPHMDWCKQFVLNAMLPGWCDRKRLQVQASVILLKKSEFSVKFVNEWLTWAQLPGFIDDTPHTTFATDVPHIGEIDTFREHRHDQAILTNLAIKYGVNYMNPWKDWKTYHLHPKDGDFTPNATFYHHRKRNNEW